MLLWLQFSLPLLTIFSLLHLQLWNANVVNESGFFAHDLMSIDFFLGGRQFGSHTTPEYGLCWERRVEWLGFECTVGQILLFLHLLLFLLLLRGGARVLFAFAFKMGFTFAFGYVFAERASYANAAQACWETAAAAATTTNNIMRQFDWNWIIVRSIEKRKWATTTRTTWARNKSRANSFGLAIPTNGQMEPSSAQGNVPCAARAAFAGCFCCYCYCYSYCCNPTKNNQTTPQPLRPTPSHSTHVHAIKYQAKWICLTINMHRKCP